MRSLPREMRWRHALVWNGTGGGYVDLHGFLPAGYSSSYAYAIDDLGNDYGQGRWRR